ncbi:MAG: hypothetical protein ACP5T6_00690 [Candidatus Micrarchaeia archaeon]
MSINKKDISEEVLTMVLSQFVVEVYSTILEEMDQDEYEEAVARETALVETLKEIVSGIVQFDALAFKIFHDGSIDRKFQINVKISGSDSTTWSIPS